MPRNKNSILEIPGYLDAVLREQFTRDVAFLGLPASVAGFDLVPLTLRHYLILRATRNPLLWGGLPTPNQLFNFLWLLSPQYDGGGETRAKRRFERRCQRRFFPPRYLALLNCRWARAWHMVRHRRRQIQAATIITEVRAWMDETMQDRPPRMKERPFDADYYSDAAFFCAHFGRAYGWAPDITLNMPMRVLFQFCNEIKHQNLVPGKSVPLCNPSDRVKANWLKNLRAAGRPTISPTGPIGPTN
jgi:hypothetical protein